MIGAMSLVPKIGLSFAGLALVAFGSALWLKYGTLDYFDVVAASFVGCFF
jgi:hypothetical protein